MSAMEIVLLIVGAVVFVVSFLLPAGREEEKKENKELVKEEIKGFVTEEMAEVKSRVDSVVEESIEYAMEKTERSLERISNEKIMAVNQYSDTVLEEINKNHKEVMFLYDMLNDKHRNLKKTVKEVNRTVKEAEDTLILSKKEQEEAQALAAPAKEEAGTDALAAFAKEAVRADGQGKTAAVEGASDRPEKPIQDSASGFSEEGEAVNSNEKILGLYREGKSKVAIAKELGLGVGEVKLVIDLYKNR